MIGSQGPRVLEATLPHVDMWNAWHAWFGNTPEGLAPMLTTLDDACRKVGRNPAEVSRTVAIMIEAPGGQGRVYGDSEHEGSTPISGSAEEIAAGLAAFGSMGLDHVQLVVDPITEESIEWLGQVLAILDR